MEEGERWSPLAAVSPAARRGRGPGRSRASRGECPTICVGMERKMFSMAAVAASGAPQPAISASPRPGGSSTPSTTGKRLWSCPGSTPLALRPGSPHWQPSALAGAFVPLWQPPLPRAAAQGSAAALHHCRPTPLAAPARSCLRGNGGFESRTSDRGLSMAGARHPEVARLESTLTWRPPGSPHCSRLERSS